VQCYGDDGEGDAREAPGRLAKEIIDGSSTSQWYQEDDTKEIDLHVGSLHIEHGIAEYLQTRGEETCWQVEEIDKHC